jgi:hypothetical protein
MLATPLLAAIADPSSNAFLLTPDEAFVAAPFISNRKCLCHPISCVMIVVH